jgi:hypothetical protein
LIVTVAISRTVLGAAVTVLYSVVRDTIVEYRVAVSVAQCVSTKVEVWYMVLGAWKTTQSIFPTSAISQLDVPECKWTQK